MTLLLLIARARCQLVISKYELNTQMIEGKSVEEYTPTGKREEMSIITVLHLNTRGQ